MSGYHLCADLAADGARLTVTDIDAGRVRRVVEAFGAGQVAPHEIYDVPADIFAPCALGAVINGPDHRPPQGGHRSRLGQQSAC